MSAEDFSKIKSHGGMEIIPVDGNGKSVFLDDKGKEYKIRIDPNNPKGFDVVDINNVQDPRVKYGDNPPNPSGQITQNQGIPKTKENPYGWDINKNPTYSLYKSPVTSVRSRNFIVNAPNGNAEMYAAALEYERYKRGVEVNGKGFPDWEKPAVVTINENPNVGNGGATSFSFPAGQIGVPTGWTMEIGGSQERLLDSIIPHELNHMAFATEFGQPVPRWADEGSASFTEDASEKSKLHNFLIQELERKGGYSFNQLVTIMQYPPNNNNAMLMIYAQGLTMREYLETQKPGEFASMMRDAFNLQNQRNPNTQQPVYDQRTAWETAIRNHYGYNSLGEFQQNWNQWVNSNAANWRKSQKIGIGR